MKTASTLLLLTLSLLGVVTYQQRALLPRRYTQKLVCGVTLHQAEIKP
jgi:hypothetical protein